MKDKFPEIYKNKVENIKSKVQKDFYYHASDEKSSNDIRQVSDEKLDRSDIINKINNIFSSPNFVYQADVNIMYKNGENINEKVVGMKDNYLLTLDGRKIFIDDISNIK